MITNRFIFTSYEDFNKIKPLFPKRNVVGDMNVIEGSFYYFTHKGRVRLVKIHDKSIWGCVYDRGFSYMKRLR